MRGRLARLAVGATAVGALLAGTASHAQAVQTVTVKCSNGFKITVPAPAAQGVKTALNYFNKYNQSGVTCWIVGG